MNTYTYLDHAATTPLRASAQEAWMKHGASANPSSLHTAGRNARLHLESARDEIALAIGAQRAEVVFTSGGTEADNLALKGLYLKRHLDGTGKPSVIILTGIEHPAVLESCEYLEKHHGAELVFVPVDAEGLVDLAAWTQVFEDHQERIALATLMWANNEVGTIQPVAEAVTVAKRYDVSVHVDAVQAFGSIPISFKESGAATMAISGHKIGAPVGIGAVLVRRDVTLHPLSHGGGQERDIRSGTMNVAAAAAFAAAATEAVSDFGKSIPATIALRNKLIEGVLEQIPEARLSGPEDDDASTRLPGNVHFIFPGCEGDSLLFMLDMQQIYSSTGSACTAGVPKPSHVLLAMGATEADARSVQRFTLGHDSSQEDVTRLVDAIALAYRGAKEAGMAAQTARIKTASDGW